MRCFANWKLRKPRRLNKTSWMIFCLNSEVCERAVSYVKDRLMRDANGVEEGVL